MAHFIVCGLGQVGYRVADLILRLGERLTIVTLDARDDFLTDVNARGARVVVNDARSDRVLLDAGLAEAQAVIACTDSDLINLEIALDTRRIAPNARVVTRLFDQTLARGLETSLGVHRALAMSVLAAPAFAAAALGENVQGMFTWRGQTHVASANNDPTKPHELRHDPKRIAERRHLSDVFVTVRHGFAAMGEAWRQTNRLLRILACAVPILAFASILVFHFAMNLSPVDAFYFVVTTLTTTGYGDISVKDASSWLKIYTSILMMIGSASVATLYSLITDFIVTSRFNELLGRRAVRSRKHVIVVGLGNVGYRTALTLSDIGAKVAVIDLQTDPGLRKLLPSSIAFIAGDGRDGDTLELAGISTAQALVTATDDDAHNLSIGLTARSLNPDCRVVVRLFDAHFAEKVEHTMGIHRALSASRIAAPGFVAAAMYDDAVYSYISGQNFVVVRPGADGELVSEMRQLSLSGDTI